MEMVVSPFPSILNWLSGLARHMLFSHPPLQNPPRWHLTLLRDLADRLLLLSALLVVGGQKNITKMWLGRTRIQKHPGKFMATRMSMELSNDP